MTYSCVRIHCNYPFRIEKSEYKSQLGTSNRYRFDCSSWWNNLRALHRSVRITCLALLCHTYGSDNIPTADHFRNESKGNSRLYDTGFLFCAFDSYSVLSISWLDRVHAVPADSTSQRTVLTKRSSPNVRRFGNDVPLRKIILD